MGWNLSFVVLAWYVGLCTTMPWNPYVSQLAADAVWYVRGLKYSCDIMTLKVVVNLPDVGRWVQPSLATMAASLSYSSSLFLPTPHFFGASQPSQKPAAISAAGVESCILHKTK